MRVMPITPPGFVNAVGFEFPFTPALSPLRKGGEGAGVGGFVANPDRRIGVIKSEKAVLLTLPLIVLSLLLSGCRGGTPAPRAGASEAGTVAVEVATVQTGNLTEQIEVTGDLASYADTIVATKLGGRIVEVRIREGDRVQKGQVLAVQDQSDLHVQLRQAEAAVQAATANLKQAEVAARIQPEQTEAQIQAARAALLAAQARLRALQTGARPQERQQAEQQVAAARANFELAKANFERAKQLYEQGAIAKQQYEAQKSAYEAAQAQLRQAEEALNLVREGPRHEEIEAAEQAVKQAEEAYRQALLGKSQIELRQQQVAAARAALAQARANRAYIQQQLEETLIRAPFDGWIAQRFAEVGSMAGQGTPVARVVDLSRLYFEATLPETLLKAVRVGMPVQVRVDAFPERLFTGKIEAIYPATADNARNLRLRVTLANPEFFSPSLGNLSGSTNPEKKILPADLPLKTGLFARGTIRLRTYRDVPLVPKRALIEKGDTTRIFVVENNIARSRTLQVRASNTTTVYAEGVQAGEQVVIRGQDLLSDGQPVRVLSSQAGNTQR